MDDEKTQTQTSAQLTLASACVLPVHVLHSAHNLWIAYLKFGYNWRCSIESQTC